MKVLISSGKDYGSLWLSTICLYFFNFLNLDLESLAAVTCLPTDLNMLAQYAAMFNLCLQMTGMSWTIIATIGAVRFRVFGLGTFHPGCSSLPAVFLKFWKRVLTLSSSASLTKLVGSSSPSAIMAFAQSVPD